MSEQVGQAVNPGQAIYDALSDGAKAAVDALPDTVFTGEDGLVAAAIFADAIRTCSSTANRSAMWTILCDPTSNGRNYVCLNVAMNNMISWSDGKLRLVLDMDHEVTPELANMIASQRTSRAYKVGNLVETVADMASLKNGGNAELRVLLESTLRDVSDLTWKRNQRANEHRDDWRVKIAMMTGTHLPAPSYVPESMLGHRMDASVMVNAPDEPHRYWKISAGRGAEEWPRFKTDSIIAMSWYDDLFDPADLPPERDKFEAALMETVPELSLAGARSIWQFRTAMSVGDPVLVYSQYQIIAQGVVTGDYYFDAESDGYYHRRGVEWQRVEPMSTRHVSPQVQRKLSLQQTLVELTEEEFAEALGNLRHHNDESVRSSSADIGTLLGSQFADAGLTYTDAQIASFYTALQTKAFVILSGISGTGKSKIAQRFADMLPMPAKTVITDAFGNEGIRLQMKPYMKKYNRFVVPRRFEEEFFLPAPGASLGVELEVNGVEGEGRIESRQHGIGSVVTAVYLRGVAAEAFSRIENEHFSVTFEVSAENSIGKITISSVDRARLSGSASNTNPRHSADVIEARVTEAGLKQRYLTLPWQEVQRFSVPQLKPSAPVALHLPTGMVSGRLANPMANVGGNGAEIRFHVDAQPFLNSLRPGSVVLVEPMLEDGSVTSLRLAPAREQGQPADHGTQAALPNHLFLPVRPDWRDGKPLIGYHNPLSGEYVRTPFLDFVLSASDDYRAGNRNAFFVILDEMNLAHVEYYFADVLSVIESGRDDEGWTVEGIPLAVGEEDADLPKTLRLPPNLYIVGTVNMDETTHPFSPKVLDRAFTIELTDVSFEDYRPEPIEGAELSDEEKRALLEAFTRKGRYPRIDKDEIRNVVETHERYRDDLQSLNTSLKRHRMHFGYRVFDEIMQFVHIAEENGQFASADDAFDHAMLMKVLPKFNGSRGKLQRALVELVLWSRQMVTATEDEEKELVARFDALLQSGRPFGSVVDDADDWRYPATGRRAALMMQDLYTEGFASFG